MSILFTPCLTGTVKISATSVTSNTALFTAGKGTVLRVANQGSGVVFVRVGTTSQTATLTDMAILSGEIVYMPVDFDAANIGVKAAATTTATVYATKGYATNPR